MIKKISILFVLLFSLITSSFADEQRKVKLDDDKHNKETIEVANFNIFLELIDVEENGNVKVKVELENLDESKGLSLFERAYDEKTLKKMRPKIKYDKIFPGSKGKRLIDACDNIKSAIHLYPSQKELIMTLSAKDGETTKATLPIYIIEYKDKNYILWEKQELILLQKEVIELEIEIDLKPGEAYVNITKECDSLLKEFDEVLFCTHKRHKPSLEEQKTEFQSKIDSLVEKIDGIIESNGWFSTEKRYKLYDEQRERLKNLKLEDKEGDCGKHVYVHRCKYCSFSLQQISHKLDDIYQMIYSSQDRSATKAAQIRSVNAMYDCAKRRRDWRKSEFKDKIVRLYNEIGNF